MRSTQNNMTYSFGKTKREQRNVDADTASAANCECSPKSDVSADWNIARTSVATLIFESQLAICFFMCSPVLTIAQPAAISQYGWL